MGSAVVEVRRIGKGQIPTSGRVEQHDGCGASRREKHGSGDASPKKERAQQRLAGKPRKRLKMPCAVPDPRESQRLRQAPTSPPHDGEVGA